MKHLQSLAKQVAFVLMATTISLAAFCQSPPSTWDTLPWKSYADFKLQLLNKSYVSTGILYDRVLPIAQIDEHPGLRSGMLTTPALIFFYKAYILNNCKSNTKEQSINCY